MGALVGRETEVATAVDELTSPIGGCVVLVGQGGIGKTSVLDAVVAEVTGHEPGARVAVRGATGAAAEADLPLMTLHDLFGADIDSGVVRLPLPVRDALSVALDPGPPSEPVADARALGLAVLEVMVQLSAEGRLLLVLDDLQWIDPGSRAVLAFALRRTPRSSVSVLAAVRPDSLEIADALAAGVRAVPIGPVDGATLTSIVEARTGRRPPQRLESTLADLSGGNPLLALELVRASGVDLDDLRELPVPERYRSVLEPRVAALSAEAQRALLAAALLSRPSLTEAARAAPVEAYTEAEAAEVIRLDHGRIHFTHPLFATLCRDRVPAAQRREMHALLAEAATDETERARHLGAAALLPDTDVAEQIEKVAAAARDRAAVTTAAELFELAAALTPDLEIEEQATRRFDAARLFHQAGDLVSATEVLQPVLDGTYAGSQRARGLVVLATVTEGDVQHQFELLRDAAAQPGLDAVASAEVQVALAGLLINMGDLAGARALARKVARDADAAGLPEAAAVGRLHEAFLDLAAGTPSERSPVWQQVIATSPTAPLGYDHPDLLRAWELMFRDEYADATLLLDGLIERARAAGNIFLEASFQLHLAEIDVRRGDLDTAHTKAERCYLVQSDGKHDQASLYLLGSVAAWQGRIDDAVMVSRAGLEMAVANHDQLFIAQCLSVLGFAELSRERYAEAVEHLERLSEVMRRIGWRNPGVSGWHADLVEAWLGVDRPTDGAALALQVRADGERMGLPSTRALATRAHGLVLAHRGDLVAAETELEDARAQLLAIDLPLQLARTLVALGVVRRRLKQKARAREDLRTARDVFVAHGATLWARRAEHELERAAAVEAGEWLTSSERDVAVLAASGATNREIAARLHVSEKTVEAVLTRVYRKLAVRSRTQLAHHLPADAADPDPEGSEQV